MIGKKKEDGSYAYAEEAAKGAFARAVKAEHDRAVEAWNRENESLAKGTFEDRVHSCGEIPLYTEKNAIRWDSTADQLLVPANPPLTVTESWTGNIGKILGGNRPIEPIDATTKEIIRNGGWQGDYDYSEAEAILASRGFGHVAEAYDWVEVGMLTEMCPLLGHLRNFSESIDFFVRERDEDRGGFLLSPVKGENISANTIFMSYEELREYAWMKKVHQDVKLIDEAKNGNIYCQGDW